MKRVLWNCCLRSTRQNIIRTYVKTIPATTNGMRLPPLPSLQEILKLYNLQASKHLSQNFILDLNVTDRFVRKCGDITNKTVVEVGPGPGSLTRSLLEANVHKLIGVEKDPRFFPALQMLGQASNGKFHLVHGDILQVKEDVLLKTFNAEEAKWEDESKVLFVGNLPFNISTPLLVKWLRQINARKGAFEKYGRIGLVLCFQKEVGERICAPKNTKDFGRLSVISQNYCETEHLFKIKGKTFVPPPKVDASVVYLKPRIKPLVDVDISHVERFCKIIFSMRRKKLFSNLRDLTNMTREECEDLCKSCTVNPNVLERRAEQMSTKEICLLAKRFAELGIKDTITSSEKRYNDDDYEDDE